MFTWHIIPHWTSAISTTMSTSVKTVFVCLPKLLRAALGWTPSSPLKNARAATTLQPVRRFPPTAPQTSPLQARLSSTLQTLPTGLHPMAKPLCTHPTTLDLYLDLDLYFDLSLDLDLYFDLNLHSLLSTTINLHRSSWDQRWVVTSYIYFVTFTWVHFLDN